MSALRNAHQRPAPLVMPEIAALPTGEGDFLPEIHGSRRNMTRLLGETMSVKTAATADAKKKRQKAGK